jgi:lipoate synthase
MNPLPPLSPEALLEALRGQFEQLCQGIADAVNQAPTGQVINHSEEKVRDLFADFRRKAYQQALQMKVDAAEAAFSPSDGQRRPPPEEQGA